MTVEYYAGVHRGTIGKTLYRVTSDPLEILYMEWARKRWSWRPDLFRVISPVGGEQNIEPISKAKAKEILTARFNATIADALTS